MLCLLMVSLLILFNIDVCFSRGSRCSHEQHLKIALDDDTDGSLRYKLDEIQKQYQFTHERHETNKKKRGLLDDDGFDTNEYFEGILEIPVIIHILYNPNIDINLNDIMSNERISSQIHRLNQDFLMQNKEIADIPTNDGWDKMAANYSMIFKLNRVIRKETNISVFINDGTRMYFDDKGGSNIIDRKHNMNLWIVNLEYYDAWTFLPGINDYKDGPVLDYRTFGDITFDYSNDNEWNKSMHPRWNLGRTLTHETGHWFNLQHIWGDFHSGTCDDNDGVDDTPNQYDVTNTPNGECPVHGSQETVSCGSNDMFMNFMNYVDDECFMFFTKGQLERSLAILDHHDGERRELTEYKEYNNDRFVNYFYFRVLGDNGDNISICTQMDTELEYVLYSDIYDMDIFGCVSTTDNQYVDVIIDIKVTDSMEYAKEDGYDYCIETNLGTEENPLFVCYKKGNFYDYNRIKEIDIFVLDKELILKEYDSIYSFNYNEYQLQYIKQVNFSIAKDDYDEIIYLAYR